MPNSMKFSFSLPIEVYNAIDKKATSEGLEPKNYMRNILEKYALESGYLNEDYKEWLSLYRDISDQAAGIAKSILKNKGFSDDITAQTVRQCQNDEKWMHDYAKCIDGDPFDKNNPTKSSLNQNIGYRIKQAVNGKVRLVNGKRKTMKVTELVITNYSVLDPSENQTK